MEGMEDFVGRERTKEKGKKKKRTRKARESSRAAPGLVPCIGIPGKRVTVASRALGSNKKGKLCH